VHALDVLQEMSESILKFYPLEPTRSFTDDEVKMMTEFLQRENETSIVQDSIELVNFEGIQFIDCGSRLDRIGCSRCGLDVPLDSWQEVMTADYSESSGFRLREVYHCNCGYGSTLNALVYEGHCGFGCACLTVRVFSHVWTGWLGAMPWIGVVEARY
jgi:hypothetical protein